MERRVALCIVSALAIVVVGGLSLDAADETTADPYEGTYVGTFHPKKPRCAECHARGTVSRKDTNYVLRVDVPYQERKKCKQTNLVFTIEGSLISTNLVLRNERYDVAISGEQIEGRRLAEAAKVRTVLQMKRSSSEKTERR